MARVPGGRSFNGPLFPELRRVLPDVPMIERTALNAWAEPEVVAPTEATGRRKLLMGSKCWTRQQRRIGRARDGGGTQNPTLIRGAGALRYARVLTCPRRINPCICLWPANLRRRG